MLPEGERGVAGVERKDAISQLDAKIIDIYIETTKWAMEQFSLFGVKLSSEHSVCMSVYDIFSRGQKYKYNR